MCEFEFIVDITNHLPILNARLQLRLQLINAMLDHVTSFEIKLVMSIVVPETC